MRKDQDALSVFCSSTSPYGQFSFWKERAKLWKLLLIHTLPTVHSAQAPSESSHSTVHRYAINFPTLTVVI